MNYFELRNCRNSKELSNYALIFQCNKILQYFS